MSKPSKNNKNIILILVILIILVTVFAPKIIDLTGKAVTDASLTVVVRNENGMLTKTRGIVFIYPSESVFKRFNVDGDNEVPYVIFTGLTSGDYDITIDVGSTYMLSQVRGCPVIIGDKQKNRIDICMQRTGDKTTHFCPVCPSGLQCVDETCKCTVDSDCPPDFTCMAEGFCIEKPCTDLDNDKHYVGVNCGDFGADCDDSSSSCTTDCTDLDEDDIPDCKDSEVLTAVDNPCEDNGGFCSADQIYNTDPILGICSEGQTCLKCKLNSIWQPAKQACGCMDDYHCDATENLKCSTDYICVPSEELADCSSVGGVCLTSPPLAHYGTPTGAKCAPEEKCYTCNSGRLYNARINDCVLCTQTEATCSDNLDNDCDGAEDCADTDCFDTPNCLATNCINIDSCNDYSQTFCDNDPCGINYCEWMGLEGCTSYCDFITNCEDYMAYMSTTECDNDVCGLGLNCKFIDMIPQCVEETQAECDSGCEYVIAIDKIICIPYSYEINNQKIRLPDNTYCGDTGPVNLKSEGECSENYECGSNICYGETCISYFTFRGNYCDSLPGLTGEERILCELCGDGSLQEEQGEECDSTDLETSFPSGTPDGVLCSSDCKIIGGAE